MSLRVRASCQSKPLRFTRSRSLLLQKYSKSCETPAAIPTAFLYESMDFKCRSFLSPEKVSSLLSSTEQSEGWGGVLEGHREHRREGGGE